MFTFFFYFPLILVHLSGCLPSFYSHQAPWFRCFQQQLPNSSRALCSHLHFFFLYRQSIPILLSLSHSSFLLSNLHFLRYPLPSLSCTLALSSFLRRFILLTLILNWFSFRFANISQFTLHNKQYKSVSLYSCYYIMITYFTFWFILLLILLLLPLVLSWNSSAQIFFNFHSRVLFFISK